MQIISSLLINAYIILSIFYFNSILSEPCPNNCNSHGRCNEQTLLCDCFSPFSGADCSEKLCPLGISWVSIAKDNENSHYNVECSNMGICNRELGLCSCRNGFEGSACERLSCPNKCSNNGECQSMESYALTKDLGFSPIYTYTKVWDANKIYGCNCDNGFTGIDCSLRDCPRGDDPLTGLLSNANEMPYQFNEIQQIQCIATSGKFTLTFYDKTTTWIPYNANTQQLLDIIQALPNLGPNSIRLNMGNYPQACSASGSIWQIEFLQNFGNLPLLIGNSNELTINQNIQQVILSISLTQKGTKENALCSNRGICNSLTGICECSMNFESSNGYNQPGSRGDCGYETLFTQFCPGLISCSGHGECSYDPNYTCSCQEGWTGADCSERQCPFDYSWFSYPEMDNIAHLSTLMECSNQGICNRVTGICQCNEGFTGASCNRLACPSSSILTATNSIEMEICSGHGTCYDISQLASFSLLPNGNSAGYTYGSDPNNPNTWDAHRIQGCLCDEGYHGYDCSLRTCPSGSNPDISYNQLDEQQVISCSLLSLNTNNTQPIPIALSFRSQLFTLYSNMSINEVQSILESISTINQVHIDILYEKDKNMTSLCTLQGNSYIITFLSIHGDLPLIELIAYNSNNISISISEIQKGNKMNYICSSRGLCNEEEGLCECFNSYGSSDGTGRNLPGNIGDCGYIEPISLLDH